MAYTQTTSGPISASNALASNQMPDNDAILFLLEPYQFPLFQKMYFSEGTSAKPVVNSSGLFSWFEDELYPSWTTLTNITGGSATEAGITIGAQIFQVNDELLIEQTMQMCYVTAASGTATTISTMNGSDLLTAATTGLIRKIGTLDHEFAGVRTAVSTQEIQVGNYLTKFNESVSMTGRQDAGDQFTEGKSFKDEVYKKIREMKLLYEYNFKFSNSSGTKDISVSGVNYKATYGKGFNGFITSLKVPYTVLTEDILDDFFCRLLASGGSDTKTAYCGQTLQMAAGKLIKQKYAIDPKPITTEYGVKLTRYHVTGGVVEMVWDPTMAGAFQNYLYAVDFDSRKANIKMRYMKDDSSGSRKFRIMKHVETPGTDGRTDKMMADLGIQIPNQEIHGVLYK